MSQPNSAHPFTKLTHIAAFAAAGAANIISLSRRAELLEEAKKKIAQAHSATHFHTFPVSIDDADNVKSIFAQVRAIDSFWKDFAINVKGNLNVVTEYLRPETLIKEKKIITVSTTGAHQRIPGMASYGASKEALVHIFMHLQEEHADKRVRITSYHPGAILTPGAKAYGFETYPIPWEDVNLPGQFALWLASKEADFLVGRFV
ncbi:hypothetical protein HO173_011028 [Letharia columbiana]|uniref:NAD(P)-binding protein n=1 Tax=Letharia columbiana TaxID=112416 RepID=A0A8H6FLD8_9LECA|nr:uncharacterized protein HO173_011028 [Letharia columbiana]KAF6230677.1 hypothetical protein HO173_011028 [Letharia columbiana]